MADPLPSNPEADVFKSKWVRPRDALVLFNDIGKWEVIREMGSRLRGGMLFAAGSPAASKSSGDNDPRFIIIPNELPSDDLWLRPEDSFWITGRITVKSRGTPYEYFGVRLEPNGLQRMADEIGLPLIISPNAKLASTMASNRGGSELVDSVRRMLGATDAQPTIKPNEHVVLDYLARTAPALVADRSPETARRKRDNPVTTGEIKAWYRGLSAPQKTLAVTDLWDLAKEHFPARHLPRKMVEPFGLKRGNGHRAKPQSPK